MSSTDLFGVTPVRTSKTRQERQQQVREWKDRHGIWTDGPHGLKENGWLAFSVPEALAFLNGYELTDEEKKDPMLIYAGYCRLLDESGISVDHMGSEYEACAALVKRWEAQ